MLPTCLIHFIGAHAFCNILTSNLISPLCLFSCPRGGRKAALELYFLGGRGRFSFLQKKSYSNKTYVFLTLSNHLLECEKREVGGMTATKCDLSFY